MFQKFVAVLLSACLATGSLPETAYVVAASQGRLTEAALEDEGLSANVEESGETPETAEEGTKESGETPETTEENTEESGETPETTEEGSKESGETSETTEEGTKESAEIPETTEEGSKESGETPESTEESTEVSTEITEESETTVENTEETTETTTETVAEQPENELETVAEAQLQSENGETDDRMLAVEIEPEYRAANANITLTGEAACDRETTVTLYLREKGTKDWKFCNRVWLNQPCRCTIRMWRYNNESLKEETTYEYAVGIEENKRTGVDNLIQPVIGEFTTTKNELTLCDTEVSVGYDSFAVKTGYTGNTYKECKRLLLYYREKGAQTWQRSVFYSWNEEYQVTIRVGNDEDALKQGTEYEYELILASDDMIPDSPGEVAREDWKKTGSFTTKQRSYELEITPDEKNSTFDTEALKVSVKGTGDDEKLYVKLTLENRIENTVTLCKSQNYTETITIKDLKWNTKYTVTGAELYLKNGSEKITVGTFAPNVTFTTKNIIPAEKITLSKNKIYLNAAVENASVYLYATTAPDKACRKINWGISDDSVARYSMVNPSEDGVVAVKAKGVGTTVIRARAAETDDVIATCEIVVGSYIIGKETENGYERVEKLTLLKGESMENLVLLQKDGEVLTPVEDYDVTITRQNIAKWEDGKLLGTAKGTTSVTFIKDGIPSAFTLEVTEEPTNLRITGLVTENEKYPAIARQDGAYEIAYKEGLNYQIQGQFDSGDSFEKTAFSWSSSDETVATVEAGVITPKKAGDVTITATHTGNAGKKEIRLVIKEVAQVKGNTVYALTNLKKKMCLKDLQLTSVAGEGWEWKNPNTALHTLSTNDGIYPFDVIYTGTDKYACVETVNVCVGTFTKLDITEIEKNHNHVLQTNNDEMYLCVMPEYTGIIANDYSSYIPQVNGLNILWDEATGKYVITASKEGKYVLKPEIRVKVGDEEKTVLTGKYEINVVKDAQVFSIKVTTDTEGVTLDQKSGKIQLDFSEEIKKQSINLNAVVTDKDGNELATALEWKIADNAVAGIKYNKKTSHQAQLTVKGTGGNTTLTVKAKDKTGYTVQIPLEIRDIRPRVATTKVTVNTAYDYGDTYGWQLADMSGNKIEVTSAYDNDILAKELYKNDKKTIETRFRIEERMEDGWRIEPVDEKVEPGTYKCQIGIRTEYGEGLFYYPITIKVIKKMPSVKVSMDKLNLFYIEEEADIKIKITGENIGVENVTWEDNSEKIDNGFESIIHEVYTDVTAGGYKDHYVYATMSQKHVDVKNGKPVDPKVTKGTLYVKLYGFCDPVEIKNFKINYTYKKPKLKSENAVSQIAPEAGVSAGSFKVYDPLKKINLYWEAHDSADDKEYNGAVCGSRNVTISNGWDTIDYKYTGNGSKKQETITCKLNSTQWREPLEVKHTIKLVNPEVKLESSTLVLNKAYKNETTLKISAAKELKNLRLYDLGIKGADKKAQQLIDKKIVNFNATGIDQYNSSVTELSVQMNAQEFQSESIKNGSYTFKVTPYYYNAYTGERTAAKDMKLKITITDKPASVTVNQKGVLNLLSGGSKQNSHQYFKMKAVFKNICSDFTVESARLTGDYAENFELYRYVGGSFGKGADNDYSLMLANSGKLKAGQSYKLTIEYTLQTASGELITVSDDFNVKMVQQLPKMTVTDKNIVLYACSDEGKTCVVEMSDTYDVEGVSGGLDCNKDGEADIVASLKYANNYYGYFGVYLEIVNPQAVIATPKGKTYKVPVTVMLTGKDGVSRNATVNLSVKVKK